MTTFAAPLYITDQDDVLDDAGESFQGYVTSRAVMPGESIAVQGAARESMLMAGASADVDLSMTLSRDFGKGTSASTVDLTPEASETHVFRKFEAARDADMTHCQVTLGDSAPAAGAWSLHRLHVLVQTEGEA